MIDQKNARGNGAVRDAIHNTPKDYLAVTQAIHEKSFRPTPGGPDLMGWAADVADWEPYEHRDIQAPAKGYRTHRAGRQLVISLTELAPDAVITFDPDDAKSRRTGVVMGNVVGVTGPEVDFVVALVGPDEGVDVLWTIHAGDPVRPSVVPAVDWAGKRVTVAEAAALGVKYVRCEGY